MSDVLQFFYGIFEKCVTFLLTEQFGLPFPIGYLFICLFILMLTIKYLTLLAN